MWMTIPLGLFYLLPLKCQIFSAGHRGGGNLINSIEKSDAILLFEITES